MLEAVPVPLFSRVWSLFLATTRPSPPPHLSPPLSSDTYLDTSLYTVLLLQAQPIQAGQDPAPGGVTMGEVRGNRNGGRGGGGGKAECGLAGDVAQMITVMSSSSSLSSSSSSILLSVTTSPPWLLLPFDCRQHHPCALVSNYVAFHPHPTSLRLPSSASPRCLLYSSPSPSPNSPVEQRRVFVAGDYRLHVRAPHGLVAR